MTSPDEPGPAATAEPGPAPAPVSADMLRGLVTGTLDREATPPELLRRAELLRGLLTLATAVWSAIVPGHVDEARALLAAARQACADDGGGDPFAPGGELREQAVLLDALTAFRDMIVREGLAGPGPHGDRPAPPDRRPYRMMHEPGAEMVTYAARSRELIRTTWRQVGWQGQSGAFYALGDDADPRAHEPGSYGGLWGIADTDTPETPEQLAQLLEAVTERLDAVRRG
jgi:hypothetical protein